MPLYECVVIARQDINTQQVDAIADSLTNLLGENGGRVAKREYWGLRNFAYRIKKNRKGHYLLFNIEAPIPAIREMERQMKINEDILRHLILRVEELEEGPSIMMQSKERRDDRPRRRAG